MLERASESVGVHSKADGGETDPRPPGAARKHAGKPGLSGPGPKAPTISGIGVCYLYNEARGCPRAKEGQGCKSQFGQHFAHVCTAKKADNSWCLEKHSKVQHK